MGILLLLYEDVSFEVYVDVYVDVGAYLDVNVSYLGDSKGTQSSWNHEETIN